MTKLIVGFVSAAFLVGCQSASGTRSFDDLPPGAVYRPGPAGTNHAADPYNAWIRGR